MQKNLDIMKVFATTTDISFDFLEQGKPIPTRAPIQELVSRDVNIGTRLVGLDDWYTSEKVILVKKK
jgi:hypothetical protein